MVPLVPRHGVCALHLHVPVHGTQDSLCIVSALHPHSLGGQQHVLAAVQFPRVSMLSAQVLGSCLGWELGLTDVPEVTGQVYGLSWEKERQTDELSLQPGVPLNWSTTLNLDPLAKAHPTPSCFYTYLPLISRSSNPIAIPWGHKGWALSSGMGAEPTLYPKA